MTVKELIEKLQEMPPDMQVVCFSASYQEFFPVLDPAPIKVGIRRLPNDGFKLEKFTDRDIQHSESFDAIHLSPFYIDNHL